MPRRVKGPDGVTHSFPDDATDDEIGTALEGLQTPSAAAAPAASGPSGVPPQVLARSAMGPRKPAATEDFMDPPTTSTAREVAKGVGKGLASTVAGLGEMAATSGLIPGLSAQADPFNPVLRHPVFTRMEEATTAENTPQMVGKGLETVAELALPTGAAANAVPRAARAAGKFQDVMSAAKNIAVNPEVPGQVGLRIMQLAERGGTMPRPVSQFVQWVTNPDKAPMTYEVARDFASNISRLSANEMQRLTPVMAREVAELRVALNKAVGEAAAKAGKGKEYAQAMKEYGQAMKLRGMIDKVGEGAKRSIPYAGAAGLGAAGATWLTKGIMDLMGGGD